MRFTENSFTKNFSCTMTTIILSQNLTPLLVTSSRAGYAGLLRNVVYGRTFLFLKCTDRSVLIQLAGKECF